MPHLPDVRVGGVQGTTPPHHCDGGSNNAPFSHRFLFIFDGKQEAIPPPPLMLFLFFVPLVDCFLKISSGSYLVLHLDMCHTFWM